MAIDYLHTDEHDLMIKNGDFVAGYSDEQHVETLLLAQKGEIKAFPLAGIGIRSYGLSPWHYKVMKKLEKHIKLQLKYDGVVKPAVKVSKDKIKIDAQY